MWAAATAVTSVTTVLRYYCYSETSKNANDKTKKKDKDFNRQKFGKLIIKIKKKKQICDRNHCCNYYCIKEPKKKNTATFFFFLTDTVIRIIKIKYKLCLSTNLTTSYKIGLAIED